MGALCKVVDSMLLLFFLVIAVGVVLVDTQTLFPQSLYPDLLVRLYKWVAVEFQHFLMEEKPHFYIGLLWQALVFLSPLALLNIYGILASKPWLNSTYLLFGASLVTTTAAILGELLGSHKASYKLLMMFFSLMGFAILAIVRGLLASQSQSGKPTPTTGNGPFSVRKKRT